MSEQLCSITERAARPGVPLAIKPSVVEQFWPSVEGYLRSVEEFMLSFDAASIRTGIQAGTVQLWSILDERGNATLALTSMFESTRGASCTCALLAGSLTPEDIVRTLIERIESHARERGAGVLVVSALPYWAERLAGKITAVALERDLRAPRRLDA
jgi:hypothetical protein